MKNIETFHIFLFLILNGKTIVVANNNSLDDVDIDPNGYMMFCPCMGKKTSNKFDSLQLLLSL